MTELNSPKKNIQKWQRVSTSVALGESWFKVRKDTIQLPSGKIVDDYFVWESPNIATVVPFTSDGNFVVCRQYRYGVDKIMYQFPAGAIDKNERPEEAAQRELEEETGYIANNLIHLGDSAAYPTKMTGWHYLFLATNIKRGGHKDEDENEQIQVELKTPKELLQLIHNNQFQVADSLAAALLAFRQLGL